MPASRKKPKRTMPMTRVGALLPALNVAQSLGVPVERYLKRAHIPPSVLKDPMRLIPRSFVGKLADSIAEREGIEDFGILVGSQINVLKDIPILGIHLEHSRTCRDYLKEAARLIGLIAPGRKVWLARDGRRWRLNFEVSGPLRYFSQHQELYTLAATIRTISDMLGRDWRPSTIWLPPGYRLGAWARDWLQKPHVKPAEDVVAFSIPDSVLRARNRLRRQIAAPRPVDSPKPPLLKAGVKSVVELLALDPALSLKIVAEAAGMPGRTLQHILSRDGMSFREIQSSARVQVAKQLLQKSKIPVSEVASRLGYTNSENFTRAFRKLTGVSPSIYRKRRDP